MAKRKTVETEVAKAEPVKKRASTPKPSAATHKKITKQQAPQAVAQPIEIVPESKAVEIVSHAEISALAYSYWEARGYVNGDPSHDWLRAEKHLLELAQDR